METSAKRESLWHRARWLVFGIVLLGILTVGGSNCWILERSRTRIFTDIDQLPANDVGLVLGTSRSTGGGFQNPFFAARIDAAAKLYQAKKVQHLVLSGDNRVVQYDEPADMKKALIERGVPESVLTVDDAGFRTLDSIVRAKKIFGLSRPTVITDDFHLPRAIALARHFEIDAVGFSPSPVPLKWSVKTRIREILARVKTVLDLYVLRTQPHFLGGPETVR